MGDLKLVKVHNYFRAPFTRRQLVEHCTRGQVGTVTAKTLVQVVRKNLKRPFDDTCLVQRKHSVTLLSLYFIIASE